MSNDAMTTLQEQIAKLNQITQNGYSGYKGSTVPIEPGANYTGILENPATKIQQSTLALEPVREADDPLAGYQLPQKEGEAATTSTDYSGVLGKLRWGKNFATSVGQGVADTGTHQIARGGNGIVEWFLDEVGNLPQWVGKEGYNNIDNVRTLLRKEEGYDKLKAAKQKDLLRGGDPSGVTQAASLWGIKMGAEDNEATRGDWNKYFGLRWNRYVNAIRRGEAAVPKDEKAATILAGMKEFEEAHPHKFDVLKPETLVPEAKDQYLVAKDSPEFKQRFDSSNDMADRWGEDATKHVKTMDELSAKALAGKDRTDPEYWGYKVGQNAVNYGVAIGATALTKNPTIGAAIVAAPVAGDAYASAREAGYSPEYAASYAALYGAAEYFPEKLAFKKLLAGAGSGILKQAGSNAVMEGMQEGITEIAQMALDQGYKVNNDPNLTFQKAIGRVFDAMVLGGIMGGLGGASHATLNKALAASPMDRAAARDSYLQEFNNIRQALEQGLPQDQLNEIIRNPNPATPAAPTNPATAAPTNPAPANTAPASPATPAATASPAPATPDNPATASPATQATPAAATTANPTDLFSQAEIDFLNDTKNPLNSATDAQSIQGAQDILANPDPALDPYRQNAETLLQEMRTKYDSSSLAPQVQQWEQHRSEGTSMWSTQPSSQAAKYSQADNDALINHFSKVIGQGAQVIDTSGILPDGSVLQGEGVTLPDGRVIMNFDNISPQISTVTGQQILSREDRAAIVGNHELSHRAERGFVDSLPDGGQLYNEIRQRLATNQVIGNLARAIQAERVAQVSAGQQAANTLIDDYTAVSEAYAELMGALARPRGYEALVDRYLDYLPRKVKKPALRKLIDKTAAGLRNVFAKWTGKNFTPQTLSNQEVADIFASINNHRYYGLNNTTTAAPQQTTQQATGPSTNPISRTGTRQAPVFSTAPQVGLEKIIEKVFGSQQDFDDWARYNFNVMDPEQLEDLHKVAMNMRFREDLLSYQAVGILKQVADKWDKSEAANINLAEVANDLAIISRALTNSQVESVKLPSGIKVFFDDYLKAQVERQNKMLNLYNNFEAASYPTARSALWNTTLASGMLGGWGWGWDMTNTLPNGQIDSAIKKLRTTRFPAKIEKSIYVATQLASINAAPIEDLIRNLSNRYPAYAAKVQEFFKDLTALKSTAFHLGLHDFQELLEKFSAYRTKPKTESYTWGGNEFTSPPSRGKPAMMASHAMRFDKLQNVLHTGGELVAPSIAVSNAKTFNGIGWGNMDMTLFIGLPSIPENSYVYAADAYTTTYSPWMKGDQDGMSRSIAEHTKFYHGNSRRRAENYLTRLINGDTYLLSRSAVAPVINAAQFDENRNSINTKGTDELDKLSDNYEEQLLNLIEPLAADLGMSYDDTLYEVGAELLRVMWGEKLDSVGALVNQPSLYAQLQEAVHPIMEKIKADLLGQGPYMELKVLESLPLSKFSAVMLGDSHAAQEYSEQLAELVANGVSVVWAPGSENLDYRYQTGTEQVANTFPNLLFSVEPARTTVNLKEYTAPKVGKAALHNLLLGHLATSQVEAKQLSLEQLSTDLAQLDLTPFPKAVRQSLYNAVAIVAQQPSQLGSVVSQLAELHPAYAAQAQGFMEAAVEAASGLAALPPSGRDAVLEAATLPIPSPKRTTYTFQGQEFTSPPGRGKAPLVITQSMSYSKLAGVLENGGKLYAPSIAISNAEKFNGLGWGGMDITFLTSLREIPDSTLIFGGDIYTPSFDQQTMTGTPEEISSQIAEEVVKEQGTLVQRINSIISDGGFNFYPGNIADIITAPNMTAEQIDQNRNRVSTLDERHDHLFGFINNFIDTYSGAMARAARGSFPQLTYDDNYAIRQVISKEFIHQVLGVPYESMVRVEPVDSIGGLREFLARDIEKFATGIRENMLFRLPYREGKVLEAMPLSNFKAAIVHNTPTTQEQQEALQQLEKSGIPVLFERAGTNEATRRATSIMPDLLFSTSQSSGVEEDTSTARLALEDVASTITLAELQAYPPQETTSLNWEGSAVLNDLDALVAAPPSEVLKGPVLHAVRNGLLDNNQLRRLVNNYTSHGELPPGYLQYTPASEVARALDYDISAEGQAALSLAYNMRWEKLKEKWTQEARLAGLKRPVQLGSGELPQHFNVRHMLHSLMRALYTIGSPLPGPSPHSEAELLKKLHVLTETADHVGALYQATMIEALDGAGAELLNEYAQKQSPHVARMLREDWDTMYELRRLAYLHPNTFMEAVEASGLLSNPASSRTVNIGGYEFTSPPAQGKTPFMIVHGMDVYKLQKTLEIGGLAAPSLGIVKSGFEGLEWLEPTVGFIMSPEKLSQLNYIMYRGDSYTPTWNAASAQGGPDTTVQEKSDIIRDLVENNLGTMERRISRLAKDGKLAPELGDLFTADIISGQELDQNREAFEKKIPEGWTNIAYIMGILIGETMAANDVTGYKDMYENEDLEWFVRSLGLELGWDISPPAAPTTFEVNDQVMAAVKKAAAKVREVRNQEKYREVKVTDFVKLEDFAAVQVASSLLVHSKITRFIHELVSMGLVVIPVNTSSLDSEEGVEPTRQLISMLPQLTFSLQPPNPNSLQSPELQQKIKEAVEENLLPPWEKIMEQWVVTNKLYGGEESWAVAADMGETELEYEDWVTVRTPAFKKWFGDWEDGKRHSIVVNPRTREPLKVYHGSLARFDTFSFKHLGSTGSAHGRGFYFTDDPQLAAGYATKDDEVGHIYSGFLNIRRLLGESNKKLRRRDVYNLLHKMVRNGSEILWDFNDLNKYQLETVLSQAVDQLFDTNTNDADILAELGNLDNAEDVHRAFGGSPGYQYTPPDGRHYYIALLPNQFKAVNNYGTFSPRHDNMMFSTAPSGSWEEAVQLGRTALSYEDWTTVRTPEFKDWFGDWETDPKNASKVINKETGEPLKVYHGTTAEFDTFRPNEALGGTIFFSPSIEEAKNFATAKGARIISGFLNVRNPRKSPVRSYDEVKAAKAAKQRGQDGIQVYDDIHSPTNWAVFSPQQFKADNSKAFDGNDPRYAYSTTPLQAALNIAYSVPPWELREDLPGIGSRAKRLWQVITSDRVKDLWADKQGELERIVKKLPGNALALAVRNGWKAYNAQVQADLVNDILPMQEALAADLAEQLNRVRATIPMYKGMRKSKAMKLFMEHLDKIGKYVYHGEERNVEIALRTGGADLAGSGRTLPEIAEVKQFFMDPARGGGELLTIYENIYSTHIKPMLEYSENRLRAAGLLTHEMEAARPNYKWYIPLYGKPEIEDPTVSHNIDDSFRSRTGGGALARDTLQNRTHNAEGRHGTEAHNLFENIFTQLESTVRRVRAQEPKQRLWEFLQTPEGAKAFEATTSQHQLGNQTTVNQAGQQTWRNQATADNQVIWQDGNEVHVMTIGNELALNAVKNFNRSLFPYEGNPLAQPGAAAWHGVAWVTRFMGSMYTRYNPSFILRNKMMDSLQQWQYILADAPVGGMTTAAGPRGYLEAVGNVAGRLKLALLAASYNTLWTGTLGKTSGFEQWFKRYEALGGVTTYASFLGRNTLINLANEAWRQAANPVEKALDVRGNLNWLAELLNKANDTMELTTRVSAFRALVESGVEEETAAHYVKDIMNFETKGDLARGINAFYPFFTTSLFDMRRILKTLSHKEGQVLLAALIGISYTMWAALAAATGDDDDGQAWVDKYPMGIASRYAIVPVVSDDGVMRGEGIRIPLGFGLGRIANTIALSWRRYFNGTDEPSDLVSNLINHAAIGSLSPIQPSDVNIKEDPVTWLGNTFLPQVLKPVLQYSSNKNWRGQPIYNPGTFRAEGELDYNTGFAATPDLYKSLAEKLYDGTGYDVAPESIAYWVETAFGGLGRDVVSGTELFLDTTGTGEPPTSSWWRNIPMLSGLTQASPSITREKYFEYRMEVTDEYNRLMDANKRGKSPDAYMRSYGYKKQFDAVEAQLRELRKYRKQVREGLHGAERQAAERQLNDAMQVLQANMVNLYEEQTRRKK